MEGRFKGWATGKAFGFIVPDDGTGDVFIHKSMATDPDAFRRGAKVHFEIEEIPLDDGRARRATRMSSIAEPTPDLPRQRGIVTRWSFGRGFGWVKPENGGDDVFLHASSLPPNCEGYLALGDVVEFYALRNDKGMEASGVALVGWVAPEDPHGFVDPEVRLARLASMGPPRWLAELAEMAQEEPWEYSHTPSPDAFPILRSYFLYTFRRLEEMSNGIRFSNDDKAMSFNTGLVTPNQEDIFAFFRKNTLTDRQPWRFAGFRKASDREFIDRFGSSTPPLADYFDDPSVLLYDRRCELFIAIDHVMENLDDRFPEELRSNPFMARQLILSAEALTKKRVYRNYKTAIPQYYRDRGRDGSVQLLLPLCLLNPARADLAMVVERIGDAYRGSTVLTLDMAYNNARLLARPDTEWLTP